MIIDQQKLRLRVEKASIKLTDWNSTYNGYYNWGKLEKDMIYEGSVIRKFNLTVTQLEFWTKGSVLFD